MRVFFASFKARFALELAWVKAHAILSYIFLAVIVFAVLVAYSVA